MRRTAFYLTCGSAVAILFSIAVSQILLGLAFAALLISGEKIRFPPIKLPLALFFVATVLAVLCSGDPRAGTPQLRKFFVFLILLLVYSTFRTIAQIRALVLLWGCAAAVSATLSIVQFAQKYEQSVEMKDHSYTFYVSERITGLASHWMTFGGEQTIVLLMLAAVAFFSSKGRIFAWMCLPVVAVSVVLGFTRIIFLGAAPAGVAYLLWHWKRRLLFVAPVVAAGLFLVAPPLLRERMLSVVRPHGPLDSNMHRIVCARTGWEMVKAHPWLGLGPEEIAPHFNEYVPADIPRPLPMGWYGHLHDIYLQYAAERGIPALVFMLWLIGKALYDFIRTRGGEARFVLHGAIAVIIAVLIEGLFEYNLGDSEVLTMFLVVVGCGYTAISAQLSAFSCQLSALSRKEWYIEASRREGFSPTPGVAEGARVDADRLSGHEDVPARGTVRPDQSTATMQRLDPGQPRRRMREGRRS